MGGSPEILEGAKAKFVGIKIPEPHLAEIDSIASERGVKRSVFIREAIQTYVMALKEGETATA